MATMESPLKAATYHLTPSGTYNVLRKMIRAKQPCMLWSPPGVAKSSLAQQLAEELGYEYVDFRALLFDPVDLRGLPWRETVTVEGESGEEVAEHSTRWATPKFLPPMSSTKKYLINIEELPAAPQSTQTALFQLILDRGIGEYQLPEGAAMMACGNGEGDGAGAKAMLSALRSRFIHIDVVPDLDDWIQWAASHDIAPEVIFFLRFRSEYLHQFDPKSKEHAYACPRTWEFASRMVQDGVDDLSPEEERALYRGTIGEAAAVEFTAFLQIWREVPDFQVILSDPNNAPIPQGSVLIALCGTLYRHADDTNMDSLVAYAKRLTPEVGEFLISSCLQKDRQLQYCKAWVDWVAYQNR